VRAQLDEAMDLGLNIYHAKLNLIKDIDSLGKSLGDFLKLLYGLGSVLQLKIDFDTFDENDLSADSNLPIEILYSSEIGPGEIEVFLEVPSGSFLPFEPQRAEAEAAPEAPAKDAEEKMSSATEAIQVKEVSEPTLRVKVSLLENLMNLAGELVLSRNQLREALSRNDMRSIRVSGQRMGQVTTELQETIMMTRLQPIDRIFCKFPRMIRDLSRKLGKEIKLSLEGREVELDKTLIEGLGDPLTHMVRNAIDHGIETPDERKRLGKSLPAHIKIQAFYEASRVIVEVADDGRGIDGEKVCQKAIDRGLLSFEKAKNMSIKDMQNLIFLPGLSTAEKVSELSGRGVGMDVVKANIDSLGGKVEIISEPGKGSIFKIKLPLTLAIIPSLILTSADEMFAIPQANVLEMLLIPAEMIKRRVEIIGNQEVLVLRGKLLPLISLNRFLGCEDSYEDPQRKIKLKNRRKRIADRRNNELKNGHDRLIPHNIAQTKPRKDGRRFHSASGLNVIVVTTGSFTFALIVDKPLFTEEIVVKQLGKDLKSLSEYSGATILGDGRIALIIDVLGLAARSGILGRQNHINSNLIESDRNISAENQALPFLCFKVAGPENYALPLFLVSRLEKVLPERLISCGDWRALQLEDKILPVFPVDGHSLDSLSSDKEWGVIVVRLKSREIGLIAALPIQVIELIPEFDRQVFRRPGISGATVWKNESLLFIDIIEIVANTRPELLEHSLPDDSIPKDSTCIALLEANSFFQNQLKLQLENQGCNVRIAGSIAELEDCLSAPGHSIKGILADLSLVKKDQFLTLRKLKQNKQLDGIKVATLWTKEGDRDLDLSHEGIGAHMLKLEMQQISDWLDHVRSAT
jgi:two-component system chemotaxis sensor kinase CheA